MALGGCASKPKGPTLEQQLSGQNSQLAAQKRGLNHAQLRLAEVDSKVEDNQKLIVYINNQLQELSSIVQCIEFQQMGDAVLIRGKRTPDCLYD